jgi:hypothetical protein
MEANNKGEYDGTCNRSACQKDLTVGRGGNWYNKLNGKYYCIQCGIRINEDNGKPYRDRVLSYCIPVTSPEDRPTMSV